MGRNIYEVCSNCGKLGHEVAKLFVRPELGLSICNECLMKTLAVIANNAPIDRSKFKLTDLTCTYCGKTVLDLGHLVKLNSTFICLDCAFRAVSEFLSECDAEKKVLIV